MSISGVSPTNSHSSAQSCKAVEKQVTHLDGLLTQKLLRITQIRQQVTGTPNQKLELEVAQIVAQVKDIARSLKACESEVAEIRSSSSPSTSS